MALATFCWSAGTATAVSVPFFLADRAYRVKAIRARPAIAQALLTAVLRKAPSGTAISAGTQVHAGSLNAAGTANVDQQIVPNTDGTQLLAAGDSLGWHGSAACIGGVGVVSVLLVSS